MVAAAAPQPLVFSPCCTRAMVSLTCACADCEAPAPEEESVISIDSEIVPSLPSVLEALTFFPPAVAAPTAAPVTDGFPWAACCARSAFLVAPPSICCWMWSLTRALASFDDSVPSLWAPLMVPMMAELLAVLCPCVTIDEAICAKAYAFSLSVWCVCSAVCCVPERTVTSRKVSPLPSRLVTAASPADGSGIVGAICTLTMGAARSLIVGLYVAGAGSVGCTALMAVGSSVVNLVQSCALLGCTASQALQLPMTASSKTPRVGMLSRYGGCGIEGWKWSSRFSVCASESRLTMKFWLTLYPGATGRTSELPTTAIRLFLSTEVRLRKPSDRPYLSNVSIWKPSSSMNRRLASRPDQRTRL